MVARLVVLAGPLCGEVYPIEGAECVLGRDTANGLTVPDRLMSRRHCAVSLRDGRYVLADLGSSNGTFVNGIPVKERTLEHGDRIRVGDSVLMFLQAEPAAASAPAAQAAGVDDRTTRIATGRTDESNPGAADPAGDIVAEVLAGRVTLQAHDMVGDSAAMRLVYTRIRKVAPSDCTVLITGETGTGKEIAARAIHQNSRRARRPFVAINCAALTESLLESELFGHEKGAFTGAHTLKKGKFELADGGTIFLDEIGELAPPLQSKLLRALQQHEFERVGGTRTIHVDVRVIAATNRDLAAEAAAGRFRQDLWYRLNVVNVAMPPLRERIEDIPPLAAHFAAKYARGRAVRFSPEALAALAAHDWPGNVRELENAIERAVVLGSSDQIGAEDLSEIIDASAEALAGAGEAGGAAFHEGVREVKRRLILDAIDRSRGNYAAAARLLGLNPTYLHRLLKNLQLKDIAARR
jgi:transcriptional regulator with GAF, ATPase, and Fis domain